MTFSETTKEVIMLNFSYYTREPVYIGRDTWEEKENHIGDGTGEWTDADMEFYTGDYITERREL